MAYVYRDKRNGKTYEKWRFQFTDYKGIRRTGTGTSSKTETTKLAEKVQAKQDAIRKGYEPAPKASTVQRDFSDVAAEYIAWGKSSGGKNSKPWAAEHADKREDKLEWWRKKLGLIVLSDLLDSQPRVESSLRELKEKGRTDLTCRSYADGVTAFCDWCFTRGYFEDDPLKRLVSPSKKAESTRRALTADEFKRLIEHCNPDRRVLYLVAVASGLRANELRSLKVANVEMVRGGLRLDAVWTKNRKDGFQPLPTMLTQFLAQAIHGKQASEPLLSVPVHTARDLDKDLEAAGIPKETPDGKIDFHALRVAYTTFVLESGANIKEAQSLARHATPDLTLITYGRARNERLSEVAELVGGKIIVGSIPATYRLNGFGKASYTPRGFGGVYKNEDVHGNSLPCTPARLSFHRRNSPDEGLFSCRDLTLRRKVNPRFIISFVITPLELKIAAIAIARG